MRVFQHIIIEQARVKTVERTVNGQKTLVIEIDDPTLNRLKIEVKRLMGVKLSVENTSP